MVVVVVVVVAASQGQLRSHLARWGGAEATRCAGERSGCTLVAGRATDSRGLRLRLRQLLVSACISGCHSREELPLVGCPFIR